MPELPIKMTEDSTPGRSQVEGGCDGKGAWTSHHWIKTDYSYALKSMGCKMIFSIHFREKNSKSQMYFKEIQLSFDTFDS